MITKAESRARGPRQAGPPRARRALGRRGRERQRGHRVRPAAPGPHRVRRRARPRGRRADQRQRGGRRASACTSIAGPPPEALAGPPGAGPGLRRRRRLRRPRAVARTGSRPGAGSSPPSPPSTAPSRRPHLLGNLVQVRADRGERLPDGGWRLVATNPVFVAWGPGSEPRESDGRERSLAISVTEPGRRVAARPPLRARPRRPGRRTLAARWARGRRLRRGPRARGHRPPDRPACSPTRRPTRPWSVSTTPAPSPSSVCGGHAGRRQRARRARSPRCSAPRRSSPRPPIGWASPPSTCCPGFAAEGDVAGVTAALLAGEPGRVDRRARRGRCPAPLARAAWPATMARRRTRPRSSWSDRVAVEPTGAPGPSALRPPSLVVGVGHHHATPPATDAGHAVGRGAGGGRPAPAVARRPSPPIDRRAGHPAIATVAARLAADVGAFARRALDAVRRAHPERGRRPTRSAPARWPRRPRWSAAGAGAALVVAQGGTRPGHRGGRPAGPARRVGSRRRPRARARLAHRTPEADPGRARTPRWSSGLDAYVEQCADLLTPAQRCPALRDRRRDRAGPGSPSTWPPRAGGSRWCARVTPASTPWPRPPSSWPAPRGRVRRRRGRAWCPGSPPGWPPRPCSVRRSVTTSSRSASRTSSRRGSVIEARVRAAAETDLVLVALQPPLGPADLADREGPGDPARAPPAATTPVGIVDRRRPGPAQRVSHHHPWRAALRRGQHDHVRDRGLVDHPGLDGPHGHPPGVRDVTASSLARFGARHDRRVHRLRSLPRHLPDPRAAAGAPQAARARRAVHALHGLRRGVPATAPSTVAGDDECPRPPDRGRRATGSWPSSVDLCGWADGSGRAMAARVVHATADPALLDHLVIPEAAVAAGVAALRAGAAGRLRHRDGAGRDHRGRAPICTLGEVADAGPYPSRSAAAMAARRGGPPATAPSSWSAAPRPRWPR